MKRLGYFLIIFLSLVIAYNTGVVHCILQDNEQVRGNTLTAWTSSLWTQTAQADFQAGLPWQVDINANPGNVQLAWIGDVEVYAFLGNNASVLQYDNTANTWSAMKKAPATIGTGGALASTGGDYIYAFVGGSNSSFLRYSISGNSWSAMKNAPAAVAAGGALTYDGSNCIYAFVGGSNSSFLRYSIAGNSWSAMKNAPAAVGTGGALACTGGDYIYAFQGNNKTFLRYSISTNSWTVLTTFSSNVGAGGALACTGGDYIYAFVGGSNSSFLRYSIAGNSWSAMKNAPAAVAAGGALTYLNHSRYQAAGGLDSQVLDSGQGGAHWNALFWDSTAPVGTGITFQVRASDTAFAKNASSPPWSAAGGTSPAITGLTAGRYKQWRVNLTTSSATVTPILREVRSWYY